MTGQEIKDLFENLIDDTIDSDFAIDLMNLAKEKIETERAWEFLKKKDNTQSVVSGDTYETEKDLPADFFSPIALYVENDNVPYSQISFQMQERFKDSGRKWYLDLASNKFYICGSKANTKSIYLFYIYNTDDLTLTTSPVFSAKFHKRIAFEMVSLIESGVDGDTLNFRMSEEHKLQMSILKKGMIFWDAQIKIRAMENNSDNLGGESPDSININD